MAERRSAKERAEADLKAAQGRVEKISKRIERDKVAAERIEKNKEELAFAEREVELLSSHPALGGTREQPEAPPFS